MPPGLQAEVPHARHAAAAAGLDEAQVGLLVPRPEEEALALFGGIDHGPQLPRSGRNRPALEPVQEEPGIGHLPQQLAAFLAPDAFEHFLEHSSRRSGARGPRGIGTAVSS